MSNPSLDTSLSQDLHAKPQPVDLSYDLEACTELMRGGSKSFFAASKLLPVRLRPPAIALYAFCRLADDAIDTGSDPMVAMQDLHRAWTLFTPGVPAPKTLTGL